MTHSPFTQVDRFSAHNYHPLPVMVSKGHGVWVEDINGKRYMDMLAAYSALNFGHGEPRLIAAAKKQLERLTLTSRAFHNDQLGPFCEALAKLCNMEMVLPMNTGAEAVETAIKTARKWGYQKKGVVAGEANILVCAGNFHGRTTTIISFSDDPQCRDGFGPFTPGFKTVPYGDAAALENSIDGNTVGFLLEPIQGEGGVVVPPDGYLKKVRAICDAHNVLMLADEIQSGLGRTGKTFACEWEGVTPDLYMVGKALGGGILPVSAVVSRRDILDVFSPGDHGSTFGGNPLACAVARTAIDILSTGELQENACIQGEYMRSTLQNADFNCVQAVRGKGLWVAIDIKAKTGLARPICEQLMQAGLLCKETHEQVIRLAPPLTITREEVDWALKQLTTVLRKT